MKKVKDNDDMRAEYKREDLGVGVRGKYYEDYNEDHNIVLLTPEVAKAFPSEDGIKYNTTHLLLFSHSIL
ncbi:hypothetical protein [Candidatus Marithrix sp. Canyon 246]|uniref:hypothetical protein n=1 Tax=Candidatus Marithrix sp. Canyon 246 TaxID=1827136 RepID=UPI00084A0F26|nr:hypothetical protein [Candidatus Marithrix sp. Canyon 246]